MSSVTAADLPADVLNLIQSLLPIDDYVRFPAVCASWRSAAKVNPHPHSDDIPWLFTKGNYDSYYLTAYRPYPANDRPRATYKIPIPNSHTAITITSSLGPRLLLCDNDAEKLLLINPFSSSSSTLYLPDDVISDCPISYFWKLLAPPDYDGRSGVALALLIPKGGSTLAYSASGGPWIDLYGDDEKRGIYEDEDEDEDNDVVLPLHGQRFMDAVYCKGALFFAVREQDEAVLALDFSCEYCSLQLADDGNLSPLSCLKFSYRR